jgi:hypothetical protein
MVPSLFDCWLKTFPVPCFRSGKQRFVRVKNPVLAAILLSVVLLAEFALAQVDVIELSAKDIAKAYAAGRFTAVDVTQAFLDRIEKYEPNYNAFISLNPDALATARALDEELMTRGARGPLHGVPIVWLDSESSRCPGPGEYQTHFRACPQHGCYANSRQHT